MTKPERMQRMLPLLMGLTVLGCVRPASDDSQVATRRDAIYGGINTTADAEVFMLVMIYPDGTQLGCSATLIGKKTLITAAHCLDPNEKNASSVQVWAFNNPQLSEVVSGESIEVVQTRLHPLWQPSKVNPKLEHDLGLGLLAKVPSVLPKKWNTETLQGLEGQPIRMVGYGRSDETQGSAGTKREVTVSIRQVNAKNFLHGDFISKGTCIGDSGGPSFHTFADGQERVVGIHSFISNNSCTQGGDLRVDAYADFVSHVLREFEPKELLATGSACTSPDECVGKLCVQDAQHAEKYCSQACTDDLECPNSLSCAAPAKRCEFPAPPTPTPPDALSSQEPEPEATADTSVEANEGTKWAAVRGCSSQGLGLPMVLGAWLGWYGLRRKSYFGKRLLQSTNV